MWIVLVYTKQDVIRISTSYPQDVINTYGYNLDVFKIEMIRTD